MSENPRDFDPRKLATPYPVWVCARGGNPGAGLLGGTTAGGQRYVAAFSAEGRANRYLAASGDTEGARAVALPDAAAFVAVLRPLYQAGFTYVVFDPDGVEIGEGKEAQPISALLLPRGEGP